MLTRHQLKSGRDRDASDSDDQISKSARSSLAILCPAVASVHFVMNVIYH